MTIEEILDQCYASFFAPLIVAVQLSQPKKVVDEDFGSYECSGGHLRVRLENERGLSSFRIAPIEGSSRTYDVELLARLFPEWQQKRGTVRLNLEQQAQLLRDHWEELNTWFAPPAIAGTLARLEELDISRSYS